MNGGHVDAHLPSPLSDGQDATECRYAAVAALIVVLFGHCGPAAVGGLVMSVGVDAVNSGSWRALAHVSQEVGKDEPSPTYADAPSAIVMPVRRRLVLTPRQHGPPRTKGGTAPSVPRMTVLSAITPPLGSDLPTKTTATLRVAALQSLGCNERFLPAVAPTSPEVVAALRSPFMAKRNKAADSDSSPVNGHGRDNNTLTAMKTQISEAARAARPQNNPFGGGQP